MTQKHKPGTTLWQIQQNIESKKLLIQSADDDIKRTQKRREETMQELADSEKAYVILLNSDLEA